jgi:Protein of unknown function (DUF4232)
MRSAKSALQPPVASAEHPADRPPNDRICHLESWFDLYRVTQHTATGIVDQGAFVPPDAVPPGRRRLTEATAVWQCNQLNTVAVDGDDSEEQLPADWSAYPPRFGVEGGTVRWVGHPDERRNLLVHGTHGRHRGPHVCAVGPQRHLHGQPHRPILPSISADFRKGPATYPLCTCGSRRAPSTALRYTVLVTRRALHVWLALAACIVLALGVVAIALRHESRSRSLPPAGRCHTSELSGTFADTEGAAGSLVGTFRLVNSSRHACEVQGFPAVALTDDAGHDVVSPPRPSGDATADPVVLAPNGAAEFVLQWWGHDDSGQACSDVVANVVVTLPGEAGSITIPAIDRSGTRIAPCGNGATFVMTLRPTTFGR